MKLKYVAQFLIYIVEVSLVAIIFVLVMGKIYAIQTNYENIGRFFTGIAVYQGLVFIFNRNLLDSSKDMALSYNTYLKYCKLYLETNSEIVFKIIEEKLKIFDSNKMLLSKEYRRAMKDTYNMISNKNISNSEKITSIECEMISAEHLYEFEDLKWKQSLILKLLK